MERSQYSQKERDEFHIHATALPAAAKDGREWQAKPDATKR
jgi:hypothetical protein